MNRLAWLALILLGTPAQAQDPNAPPDPAPPAVPAVPVEPAEPADPPDPADPPGGTRVPPVVVAPGVGPAPVETVSLSGRFRIRGGDNLVRGALAVEAEDVRVALLRLTGGKEADDAVVFVVLHGREGDKMRARSVAARQVIRDAGFDLEIHVHLSHGVDIEAFRHAVVTAMVCCQAAKAANPPAGDTPLVVPPWLVEGLREAAAWHENRPDRKLYEVLYRHGGLYKPTELFAVDARAYDDLDGAMRAAFRGSAGAMVMAMAEQPLGQEGLAAFLTEVTTHQGEMPALLRRHFPEMNLSDNSLAKWLALKLADLAAPSVTEALSVRETDTALTQALLLHFRDEAGTLDSIPVEQWEDISDLPEPARAEAVRQAQDALVRLSFRCFPSYRPLLREYQTALADIARGRTRKTAAQLAGLAQTRAEMLARCERAADVLDWFEITRARETSGAFDDYRRLKARLADNPTVRDDPLTVYLDRLDPLFARKETSPAALPPRIAGPGYPESTGWDDLPDLPGNLPRHLPIDDVPLNAQPLPEPRSAPARPE